MSGQHMAFSMPMCRCYRLACKVQGCLRLSVMQQTQAHTASQSKNMPTGNHLLLAF